MNLLSVYDFLAVELEEVRELFDQEFRSDEPVVVDLIEQVGKFRGKMLRPILVLLCGKACGQVQAVHHVIAAVTEMVHMATLVHDDVLDEAQCRRRGRTINALEGNETAVMLGDLLLSHAFGLSCSLDRPEISRMLAATMNTVCEGELLQLYYRGCYDLNEERYLEIIAGKTASLLASCCYLGAQATRANEAICQAMEAYGRNVGMAFQIMDDVTDIVGDERKAGKTLGTDWAKEKVTLPMIHHLRSCPEKQRESAKEFLRLGDRKDTEALWERLARTQSLEYARGRARQYAAFAREQLPEGIAPEVREILEELATTMVT